MNAEPRNQIKSVEKALDILLLFGAHPELSNIEVAEMLGCSTSTASRMLITLFKKDFLVRNATGKYRLGGKMLYLCAVLRSQNSISSLSIPIMERIRESTDETIHIFARDGIYRYCAEEIPSRQKVKMTSTIGAREPLWIGCTGRVLLAFIPAEQREELLSQIKQKHPEVDVDLLREKVLRVQKLGYATKDGEWDKHCGCVAAPCYAPNGELLGALGLSAPDFRFPSDPSTYISLVTDAAKEISSLYGHISR